MYNDYIWVYFFIVKLRGKKRDIIDARFKKSKFILIWVLKLAEGCAKLKI